MTAKFFTKKKKKEKNPRFKESFPKLLIVSFKLKKNNRDIFKSERVNIQNPIGFSDPCTSENTHKRGKPFIVKQHQLS